MKRHWRDLLGNWKERTEGEGKNFATIPKQVPILCITGTSTGRYPIWYRYFVPFNYGNAKNEHFYNFM
jgi:hypothetical protein